VTKFVHPEPIDNEIILDPCKVILSQTNFKGVIQYGNDYFVSISKYEIYEMMGKPHNIIRHPDMPKVIFKFMWERLHKGENLYAVVKNLAKDGSYYWVMTSFETTYDEFGNISTHYARRKAVPKNARKVFEELYKKIVAIEKTNIQAAENYFYGFLENTKMTYDEFFLSVVGMNEDEITSYFQNNTNLKSTDLEKNDLKESITDLKKQVEELKSSLKQNTPKTKPKKGFFKRFFSDD